MTTIAPKNGFSLANLTAESRSIDTFGCDGFSDLYGDRLEVVIPEPTPADRKQYDMPRRGEWDQCDGADEYRDQFFPMMNALWPVDLAYGRSPEEAAALMNRHGGATSLITIDDDHFIAMTGGGMDLSWHIAAAYVCCGCVPPLYILESITSSPFHVSKLATRAIMTAARQGAAHLRYKAKRLSADLRKMSAKKAAA